MLLLMRDPNSNGDLCSRLVRCKCQVKPPQPENGKKNTKRNGKNIPKKCSPFLFVFLRWVAKLHQPGNYFSRCSGSFWAAYVCVAQGDLCVFAVSDTVGVVPMWLALGEGFILLSPYWPSEQVPLSNLSCNLHLAIRWRQASPRLMHQWSASGGLEASMPDHFFGLHERKLELEMAEAKRGEEAGLAQKWMSSYQKQGL